MRDRTRIVAEIGENHLGRIELAKQMIQEAATAGADIVKFQSYRGKDFKDDDPEKEWFCKVELSNEAHFELKRLAEVNGLEFLSSPFSRERAQFLIEELRLKRIKIASGVMLNFSILDFINSANSVEEVIVSTGMATIDEIKRALARLNHIPKLTVLHCTTQYPCQDTEANLLAVQLLQEAFPQLDVGYSDHTVGPEACLAVAALGAKVIEKHFTMDKWCTEGTDHVLSLEPLEFRSMVSAIRRIEVMRGVKAKGPTAGEGKIREFVRSRFPS
jgi:N,N'-diacetyllegionaminate synthase